jgi:hypothetical protein
MVKTGMAAGKRVFHDGWLYIRYRFGLQDIVIGGFHRERIILLIVVFLQFIYFRSLSLFLSLIFSVFPACLSLFLIYYTKELYTAIRKNRANTYKVVLFYKEEL